MMLDVDESARAQNPTDILSAGDPFVKGITGRKLMSGLDLRTGKNGRHR
jgi:hypothetical protein